MKVSSSKVSLWGNSESSLLCVLVAEILGEVNAGIIRYVEGNILEAVCSLNSITNGCEMPGFAEITSIPSNKSSHTGCTSQVYSTPGVKVSISTTVVVAIASIGALSGEEQRTRKREALLPSTSLPLSQESRTRVGEIISVVIWNFLCPIVAHVEVYAEMRRAKSTEKMAVRFCSILYAL